MRKYKTLHRTKLIKVKSADVDNNIITLVRWLNSFNDIVTQFSCEGEPKKKGKPYYNHPGVLFSCYSLDDLRKVTEVINKFNMFGSSDFDAASILVEYTSHSAQMRFFLKFKDKKFLLEFNRWFKLSSPR